MSKSTISVLSSQWFGQDAPLAYWLARRWCQRLLVRRAVDYCAADLAEFAQDAVCRGFDRFRKRCAREVCGRSDRRRWLAQCVMRGVRDALRCKSTFGSITRPAAVRDDVLNRGRRVSAGFVHGDDGEKQAALEQVHYQPVAHAVQRWEVEQLVDSELPARLRASAVYAAAGLTHNQSAILQGASERTVRNRLAEIREILNPDVNVYAVIVSALSECLAKPGRRSGGALPLFAAAAAPER